LFQLLALAAQAVHIRINLRLLGAKRRFIAPDLKRPVPEYEQRRQAYHGNAGGADGEPAISFQGRS
jgi:hypothetical protein